MLKYISIIFLAILITSGCTRKSPGITTLTLNSHVGAQSALVPQVIVVNITGPGLAPIYYSWERCHANNPAHCPPGTLTPPTQLSFEVDKGPNRLFQVLAAYENSGISFRYGDQEKTLSSSQENISINLTPISNSSGKKFDFAGLYSTAAHPTPSGIVTYYYTPVGRPSMKIKSSPMYNGWFELFGIDGASFNYVLTKTDGTNVTIFNNMNLDTQSFPESAKILRIAMPAMAIIHDIDYDGYVNSPEEIHYEEEMEYITGFFTDSSYQANEEKACFHSAPSPILLSNLIAPSEVDLDNLPSCYGGNYCQTTGQSYNLKWTSNPTSGPTFIYRVSSGYGINYGSAGSCYTMGNTSAHNNIAINFFQDLISKGRSRYRGMKGPYKMMIFGGPTYTYVDIKKDYPFDDNLTVNFEYLPGVTVGESNSMFDGTHIYYKTDSTLGGIHTNSDDIDCSALTAQGYQRVDYTTSGSDPESVLIPDVSFPSSNYTVVYLCPYKNISGSVKYLTDAVVYEQSVNP